jgi:gamma-glutamylcysteine synthetase
LKTKQIADLMAETERLKNEYQTLSDEFTLVRISEETKSRQIVELTQEVDRLSKVSARPRKTRKTSEESSEDLARYAMGYVHMLSMGLDPSQEEAHPVSADSFTGMIEAYRAQKLKADGEPKPAKMRTVVEAVS